MIGCTSNEVLRIEEALGGNARFAGEQALAHRRARNAAS